MRDDLPKLGQTHPSIAHIHKGLLFFKKATNLTFHFFSVNFVSR